MVSTTHISQYQQYLYSLVSEWGSVVCAVAALNRNGTPWHSSHIDLWKCTLLTKPVTFALPLAFISPLWPSAEKTRSGHMWISVSPMHLQCTQITLQMNSGSNALCKHVPTQVSTLYVMHRSFDYILKNMNWFTVLAICLSQCWI